MNTEALIEQAAVYVKALFEFYNRSYLLYHNLRHTQSVVQHAKEIGAYYNLSSRSTFMLTTAAWFHDTGQLIGDMKLHEERSVEFMNAFFDNRLADASLTDEIAACILATKMPVAPVNDLEKILCDADTYHLGTKDFKLLDDLVWEELELRLNKPIKNKTEKSLQFLMNHRFYTSYCQKKLTAGKNINIAGLKTLLAK